MDRKKFLDRFQKRRQKIVYLRDTKKMTWLSIALKMGGVSQTAVMRAYKREKENGTE